MPTAVLLVQSGFETVEALGPVDILRRAGLQLSIVSCTGQINVTSGQKVTIVCDDVLQNVKDKEFDVVIIPGGLPNAKLLGEDREVVSFVKNQINANRWTAAICAAPACVLAANGLMNGAKGVVYPAPEFEKMMGDCLVTGVGVYVDESHKISKHGIRPSFIIVTGKGPAFAGEFGLKIAECLNLSNRADVQKGMLFE